MAKVGKILLETLMEEMAGLSGKEARTKAHALAQRFNVSEDTIYRLTESVRPGRKRRADAGESRMHELTEAQLSLLMKMHVEGMIAEQIIEVMEENGYVERGLLSQSVLKRWLVKHDINRSRLDADVAYRPSYDAKYANLIWQVDYTTAEFFYLDGQWRVEIEPAWSRNKNRAGNQRTRIHLFHAVDQHSKLSYIEFMGGGGTTYWLDFLYNAMRRKSDNFPLQGIPKMIGVDNDSVVKSRIFVQAMEKLGIKIFKHAPGASYSKGVVESGFQKFQRRQAVSKVKMITTLADWNDFAEDMMLKFGNAVQRGSDQTPIQKWMTSIQTRPDALRRVPEAELYDTLKWDEHTRVVKSNLTIEFNGVTIQLPEAMPYLSMIKKEVRFYTHPGKHDMIRVIWEGQSYDVAVQEVRTYAPGQKPESLPQTERQKLIALAATAEVPSDMRTHGWYKERHANDKYLVGQGQEFDDTRIDEKLVQTFTLAEAIERLRLMDALPQEIEVRHRDMLVDFFKSKQDRVTAYDLDKLAEDIKAGKNGRLNMTVLKAVNE